MERICKKRVLFVDDEPKVLHGLRRLLRGMLGTWEIDSASNGPESLDMLSQKPYDVIVTDMRMPIMDGASLLAEVRQRYPHMVRIALSGQTSIETSLQASDAAHSFLQKPCSQEKLIQTLQRAFTARDMLANPKLERIISGLKTVPSLPLIYTELTKELYSPDSSADRVGKIIARDMGMSAKILQLVNSAFFGLSETVFDPGQAVVLLGLNTIRALSLSSHVFAQFDDRKLEMLSLNNLWRHSMRVASLSKEIARLQGCDKKTIDNLFVAGLLHDVGKLVLGDNYPHQYHKAQVLARNKQIEIWQAERKIFGSSHCQVGAYLLAIWGLPEAAVINIAFHHQPLEWDSQSFSSPLAVFLANALVHEEESHSQAIPFPRAQSIDLASMGLADRLDLWKKACGEIFSKERSHGRKDPIR